MAGLKHTEIFGQYKAGIASGSTNLKSLPKYYLSWLTKSLDLTNIKETRQLSGIEAYQQTNFQKAWRRCMS